jgi:bifunctional non-homologous end joining protein LigD
VARSVTDRPRSSANALPRWIQPQLTKLTDTPPDGSGWLHEIKFDGYRLHARLDHGAVRLLTRTGLDWTHKYPAIAAAVSSLGAKQAYLDGELCGVRPDGTTSFSAIQNASDTGKSDALVFFLFDLLYLDGEMVGSVPLIDRKAPSEAAGAGAAAIAIQRSSGRTRTGVLCQGMRVVARRDRLKAGRRALCSRQSRLVAQGQMPEPRRVGWTDPEGSRPFLGALLLAYYTPDGRLVYAGRAGGGINNAKLERLWHLLQPLAAPDMPLDVSPPRSSRFGSPLVLSRVHWVRAELVVEVKYLSWTDDNLLRQVIYQALREDKPPTEVRRPVPHPKPMVEEGSVRSTKIAQLKATKARHSR